VRQAEYENFSEVAKKQGKGLKEQETNIFLGSIYIKL